MDLGHAGVRALGMLIASLFVRAKFVIAAPPISFYADQVKQTMVQYRAAIQGCRGEVSAQTVSAARKVSVSDSIQMYQAHVVAAPRLEKQEQQFTLRRACHRHSVDSLLWNKKDRQLSTYLSWNRRIIHIR